MIKGKPKKITDLSRAFLEPRNSTHRQYEALRAYFVDELPSKKAALRFGYTEGSFRVLVHDFRRDSSRPFFLSPAKGPQRAPKSDPIRQKIVLARKQNLSIYDISRLLLEQGHSLSAVSVGQILKEEGFARLPRRADEERPSHSQPEKAPVADVGELDLSTRQFRTQFGGLFLFVPYLVQVPWEKVFKGFPGSKMIPAPHALRSLLGLKLYGSARHSHVMSEVFDPGLALFAGLNCIPKRSFLTEYSCRITPHRYPPAMKKWFEIMSQLGLPNGKSFDLDFHTIPFHGEDALVEKHYVSKRSRRQKGLLVFLAQDADTRVFCYGNAQVLKKDQNDEVLRFVDYWKERTGHRPQELIFDSKLTTYSNLNRLNEWKIDFITLRRRSRPMLQELAAQPSSAWRQIELKAVSRIYRNPRIIDKRIELSDYEGPIRQIIITDLGHEDPTILLTNQLTTSPAKLIERYARRMIIENSIEDGIDFFHMDALSSAVPMKVDCDLQLTLMASSLYRLFGAQVARGYETAKSKTLFRDFVDAAALVDIDSNQVTVRFQKRAHNPLLLNAKFDKVDVKIPWLNNRRLHLVFG
jgi:transposase